MNPVIGLDVSKGESQVQAFLDKGKPYRKSFSVTHDLQGLGSLLNFLKLWRSPRVVINLRLY
jgi:transposase